MLRMMLFPLLIAIAAFASAAEARVVVTFHESAKYADVGWQPRDASDALKEIERHLQRLGETYLAAGQTVRIEVLDVDLAGRWRFNRRAGVDIRVLKGAADWPTLRIRYVLEDVGKAGEVREETIADMNYLTRPILRTEKLAYEKRMLEEWFKARFALREAAGR